MVQELPDDRVASSVCRSRIVEGTGRTWDVMSEQTAVLHHSNHGGSDRFIPSFNTRGHRPIDSRKYYVTAANEPGLRVDRMA